MSIIDKFKLPFNPIPLVVSLIVSLTALSISLYFNFRNLKTKSIVYLDPEVSKIYDSKSTTSKISLYEEQDKSSQIEIVGKDSALKESSLILNAPASVKIEDDIYLLTTKIWNNGNVSIDTTDVRKELIIDVSGEGRLIESKIEFQYDSIAQFRIIPISPNKLLLKWRYFDSNFGFKLNLFFTGKSSPSIKLSASILGTSIRKADLVEKPPVWSLIVAIIANLVLMTMLFTVIKGTDLKDNVDIGIGIILALLILLLIIITWYFLILPYFLSTTPPF